jgi:hypothetical protein
MPFVGKYFRAGGTAFERKGTQAIVIKEINEMKECTSDDRCEVTLARAMRDGKIRTVLNTHIRTGTKVQASIPVSW